MKFLKIFVATFLLVGGGTTAVAWDDPKELESNCDAGNLDACVKLGTMFKVGMGFPKDYARAASLYQKACDGGFSEGCRRLGVCYEFGSGVQKDLTRAASLFEKACSLGNSSGCWDVARLHHPQKGALKDAARWAVFMEKACNLGNWQGQTCRTLGLVFDLGVWGVPKDSDHATELFKKGCLYGNEDACDLITR